MNWLDRLIPTDFDPFDVYRRLFAAALCVYTLVRTLSLLLRGRALFYSRRRPVVLARNYALVLLLRTPLRRFRAELLQITLLLVALGLVLWAHEHVETWL